MNAPFTPGPVYHPDVEQGSDEWHSMRRGILTASEMKLILTPTLKVADNDKTRAHVYELLAQNISGYTEPTYISDDMLRGMSDEVDARILYDREVAPVTSCGFITNSQWGFTLGYSPDGLVGLDGLIEVKSRKQRFQVQTICEGEVPADYMLQLQTGLLVSDRKWIDFLSYSGGLPMFMRRVYPDQEIQAAILNAASGFYERLAQRLGDYQEKSAALLPTERKIEQEMVL